MAALVSMPHTRPLGSHLGRHLGGQETRPHTDVQHLLAGLERERGTDAIALGDDVGGGVRRLDPTRRVGVELHHGPILLPDRWRGSSQTGYVAKGATRALPRP